jgi:hypothetical protein
VMAAMTTMMITTYIRNPIMDRVRLDPQIIQA